VFVIADELQRIASRVFALNNDRAPAVLEVIAALLAHEWVPYAAKIDPCMRELVNEQRAGIQEIDVVKILPLVGRRPRLVRVRPGRGRRRAASQHIQDDAPAVTLPAGMQESAFR